MHYLIVIIGAVVLLAVDLIAKAVFVGGGGTVIPGLVSIEPIRNYGAAFGIFQDGRIFLIITTFVILAAGVVFYLRFKQGRGSKLFNVGCAFVLGGALGNLFDRLFLGYVRDFLKFDFLDFLNFPICNLADVFLNVGVVILVVYFIFVYRSTQSANKS